MFVEVHGTLCGVSYCVILPIRLVQKMFPIWAEDLKILFKRSAVGVVLVFSRIRLV